MNPVGNNSNPIPPNSPSEQRESSNASRDVSHIYSTPFNLVRGERPPIGRSTYPISSMANSSPVNISSVASSTSYVARRALDNNNPSSRNPLQRIRKRKASSTSSTESRPERERGERRIESSKKQKTKETTSSGVRSHEEQAKKLHRVLNAALNISKAQQNILNSIRIGDG